MLDVYKRAASMLALLLESDNEQSKLETPESDYEQPDTLQIYLN